MIDNEILSKISKELKTVFKEELDEVAMAVAASILTLVVMERKASATGFARETSYHVSGFVSNLIFFHSNKANMEKIAKMASDEKGVFVATMAVGVDKMPDISERFLELASEQTLDEMAVEVFENNLEVSEEKLTEQVKEIFTKLESAISGLDLIGKLAAIAKVDKKALAGKLLKISKKKAPKTMFSKLYARFNKPIFGIQPVKMLAATGVMILTATILPAMPLLDMLVIAMSGLGAIMTVEQVTQISTLKQKAAEQKDLNKLTNKVETERPRALSQEIQQFKLFSEVPALKKMPQLAEPSKNTGKDINTGFEDDFLKDLDNFGWDKIKLEDTQHGSQRPAPKSVNSPQNPEQDGKAKKTLLTGVA